MDTFSEFDEAIKRPPKLRGSYEHGDSSQVIKMWTTDGGNMDAMNLGITLQRIESSTSDPKGKKIIARARNAITKAATYINDNIPEKSRSKIVRTK